MSDNDPSRFAPPGQEGHTGSGQRPLIGPPPGAQPATPYAAPYASPGEVDPAGFGPPTQPGPAGPGPTGAAGGGRGGRGPGSWVAVAVVALVVGMAGGYAGSALHDGAAEETLLQPAAPVSRDPGRVDPAPLPGDNDDVTRVADTLLPSTVQIFAEVDGVDNAATGSGFVLDGQGRVVTNNHVVADSARDSGPITVVDHAGKEHAATVVGRSQTYDLAVLDVEDATGLQPAALGSSDDLRVGESVVAFGSPLGLTSSVTVGIVSALHRPVTTGDSADSLSYIDAVQTDAAINPGNSGGPLVNLGGQVIGVNSAIASAGGGQAGNIGVGFAIPINQVKVTVAQLLEDGVATYPVMGAEVDTRPSTSGARISSVNQGSPAARAGVRQGDRVTLFNGAKVTDGVSLIVAIRAHQPGEKVELTLVRAGERRTVTVTLAGQRES